MKFTPEQMIMMLREDPTLSENERMMMIAQIEQAANSGLSVLTPGRLYSIGLGALAGWLAGKLVTGTPSGGLIGSIIGGGLGFARSGESNEDPPGFSLDHRSGGW